MRQTSVKLQKQTEILKLDVQGLKQKKDELENEVIEKDILNTTLKRKNVTLKEINEECKKQNDIYYNMILDIKRSLTWRIGCVITEIPRIINSIIINIILAILIKSLSYSSSQLFFQLLVKEFNSIFTFKLFSWC